ncbi:MAG: hypothetical protein J6D29_05795 [Solobacterium sp.]|nr:hypothetical protein [Solobacterium sp.]
MNKENLTNEQLSNVSGGTDAGGGMTREELDARLTSVGVFSINEISGTGLLQNEALVPIGCGINIGEEICICAATYETKTVKNYYDPLEGWGIPVIVVSSFRSKSFGINQDVKVWDR